MATTLCSFATANKAFTPEECERIKGMGAALAVEIALKHHAMHVVAWHGEGS